MSVVVADRVLVASLAAAGLNIDYRPRLFLDDSAPTEHGVAFDANAIRTQTVCLIEGEAPVALMTLVIEPRIWLERQRFLKREGDLFVVADIAGVLQIDVVPAFAVGPGWTFVKSEYRARYGRLGVELMMQMLAAIADAAPADTWFMVSAAGPLPFEEQEIIDGIWERGVGSSVEPKELPVTTALVGTPRCESRATATFARLLGWGQLDGVADQRTLGPVFAKKIRR